MCGALAWMAALVCVSLESARHYRAGGPLTQNCTHPWDFRSQKQTLILVVVFCCMSRGAPGDFRSSRRSVCHPCGNTVHLNSVEAAKVVLYLVLPSLGDCFRRAQTCTRNRASQTLAGSRFQSAFHRALKRARCACDSCAEPSASASASAPQS